MLNVAREAQVRCAALALGRRLALSCLWQGRVRGHTPMTGPEFKSHFASDNGDARAHHGISVY